MRVASFLARLSAWSPRTRWIAGGAVALALTSSALVFAGARDSRVALFATPLAPDQRAEVETALAAWRVAYVPLADNVRIDPRARAEVLLKLSLAGIPHRHLATTDEAFAHVGALTPQSVLDAQSRDALAAELAQGLRGLDGIVDARVIVAPATSGVYADEPGRDASASVRLTLAPGTRLRPATVAAIRAFVAGGVGRLDPEHVTVLDDRGVPDTSPDDASLQDALQTALDGAFGGGATIVRVHREPFGERRAVHDVTRTALAGTLDRSSADEHYSAAQKSYGKSSASETHGSAMHDETRELVPDATARLSVAVFVDGARLVDLEKIRALAAATVGIDERRGDTLRVEAVRFATSPPPRLANLDLWAMASLVTGIAPQTILVAGALVLLVLGARPTYALAVRAVEQAGVREAARGTTGLPPARVRGALAGEPPHVAAAVISALPAATATAVLELYPPEERAQIVRRLARAAADLVPHPEELLRGRG